MRPAEFDQSNGTLGGGPALRYGTEDDVADLEVYRGGGGIISAWRPGIAERLRILFGGRVWLCVWTPATHAAVSVEGRAPFPFDPEWFSFKLRPFGLRLLQVFNRASGSAGYAWGFSLCQWGQRHLLYVGHDAFSLLWVGKSK